MSITSDARDLLPPPAKKNESVLVLLAALLAMTLLAAAVGWFVGSRLLNGPKVGTAMQKAEPASPSKYVDGIALRELPPVVTTLAEPPNTWVRLQASIVYDAKQVLKPDVLGAEITSDFLGYIKTLTAAQIGGPSGLLHLREDLDERAQIRSDGHVREVLIETMVVQ